VDFSGVVKGTDSTVRRASREGTVSSRAADLVDTASAGPQSLVDAT